ncbi:MAG: hypothetical protein RQ993_04500 [Bacteroidota bacterium]|nr:hypothetical protein [Bacteroidota bacterium]
MAGRRHRRRRALRLPPELQNLRITIRENGEVDLGVCREALIEFLQKCAKNRPADPPPKEESK